MRGRFASVVALLLLVAFLVGGSTLPSRMASGARGPGDVAAQVEGGWGKGSWPEGKKDMNQEDREAAAARAKAAGLEAGTIETQLAQPGPGDIPDYFGSTPNYALSPLPELLPTPVPNPPGTNTFYFAEGTTRPNFDPYICIQNPGDADADVTITYMKGDATTDTMQLTVPADSRATVSPRATLGTGDDGAHDFSAKVECTNGQYIVAERPMYFDYYGGWTGGHDVIGATAPAPVFYFAEGTTRPNFDPYICIQNPGDADADVTITYMRGDATTDTEHLIVPMHSRATVNPKTVLGTGDDDAHDFSAKVECTNGQLIVAERPMYFNYGGKWTGGHNVVGATGTSTTFYFAEGTTRPDFDPYICIQNPSDADAEVTVTYMTGDSTIVELPLTVTKNTRVTISPRDKLGTGDDGAHDFSARVECTNNQQIVVERPMYFNYRGMWSGGHNVVGAPLPAAIFFFAEGTARPDFDPYICIQNPGLIDADVTITYMKGDGNTDTDSFTVKNSTRVTVNPRAKLGTGDDGAHDFSARVECTNGQYIVAERPMYFNYGGKWTGGHDTVGLAVNIAEPSMTVVPGTGMRKFVDTLPGLGEENSNNLGQYIPVAVPDTTTYPGSDYYEIELGEYYEQLHSDLPPTQLRGYRQTNTTDPTVSQFHYLGPIIVAERDRPVRLKFTNNLPTGEGGDLFVPTDTTLMGAGMGPDPNVEYSQNRAAVHLHGGNTPWISDGTPFQWITPAGETDDPDYDRGESQRNVPDMPDPGDGAATYYYTNQQSSRLLFYHDHAVGITRLNVYVGEAAPYIIRDAVEQSLIANGIIPSEEIPLVIQDKTFVPDDAQLTAQDPTWDKAIWGGMGNLWLPHVYMPNQNPADPGGMNAMARWHYGPWFWPPTTALVQGPQPNPYYDPVNAPWQPPEIPGTPLPSMVMEAFMDTPVVNGTAYPVLEVEPQAYRFRILNAANDRFWNLQLYKAVSNNEMWREDGTLNDGGAGEVKMVPAAFNPDYPETWPTDGREGGVPDPATKGPEMIQIGTEGGFLPAPVVLPNQPVTWNRDPTTFNAGNVDGGNLILGPAERADVVVDFSQFAGQTLILYNDSPAPFPALDPRYDYYTGAPDLTDTGGSPGTQPGYGPNTRTIMQIKVAANPAPPAYNVDRLFNAFRSTDVREGAFAASQDEIIVPQSAYDSAYNAAFPDHWGQIYDTEMTFFNGPLPGLQVTNGGNGYTSAPAVSIAGGGGAGATATASISGLTSVTLDNGGAGYTSIPAVTIAGGGGSGATAEAVMDGSPVAGVTVTAPGSGYTVAPSVVFSGGGGTGATAEAQISGVTGVTITDPGSGGYTVPPDVTFTGGSGTGAEGIATIDGAGFITGVTITNGGSGYDPDPPTVTFTGGEGGTGGAGTAVVGLNQVTGVVLLDTGSAYTSAPTVALVGGDGSGAAAAAAIVPYSLTAINLTNPGSDYTSAPTVTITGGGGAGALATAVVGSGQVTGLLLTAAGDGYVSAPTVTLSGGGGTGATAVATGITIPFEPKAIQDEMGEAYDKEYGRMSGFLGLQVGVVTPQNRGFVLYPFISPPVDMHLDSVTQGAKTTLGDGTQIWKITHNGVDTHTIHFHKYDVQIINRVAWDNQTRGPDPNELGWKETVRVNPLEDTIVAMRPVTPVGLPFELPNSVRLMDPTKPEGALLTGGPGGYFDPNGNPVTAYGAGGVIANQFVNFGWEFVLHCHLLSHEEMDMMHAMGFVLKPQDPSGLTATGTSPAVDLSWTDNSEVESEFLIEWGESATGPWNVLTSVAADSTTYTDTSIWTGTRYYRLTARNRVGSAVPEFPVMDNDSAPIVSNAVTNP
ncbi:MAG: multicopper oxidase domain-containing protein [Actinomycetota bacterium]